jgi:CheY-like chemotaxis protein
MAVPKSQKGEIMNAIVPCDRMRTLIVDDEEGVVNVFRMILERSLPELTLDLAYNGLQAVKQFAAMHHSVLVMDLHMPVMDGQRAFMRIKELCKTRKWEMPSFVFCTAYSPHAALMSDVTSSKDNCLLIKPVASRAIINAVKEHL